MSLALYRHAFRALGSPCEIQLYAESEAHANALFELATADVLRIEHRYSRYRDDSLLSAINRLAAQGGSMAIDAETFALLQYADTCNTQSGGLFDITSGVLRQAWRYDEARLPSAQEIAALRERIGWHRLRFTEHTLTVDEPGIELDLGGIGKEYAVDRAAAILSGAGVRHGLVDLGGDIHVIGPHADGRAWSVGIRHPRVPGALLTTLAVARGAVATSGDYARCIVVDGQRLSHILNPRTGWPVRGLATVTVLAPHCVVAGSACTIAMLFEHRGKRWLADLGLDYLWVDEQGRQGGPLLTTP